MNFPAKLSKGDQIRVISPARSIKFIRSISSDIPILSQKKIESLGLYVTYGKNSEGSSNSDTTSIKSRLQDLEEAFLDPDVKAIISTIGGYNCGELLNFINYDIIRKNPKIFIGYSNITSLQNALLKKAELVTYYGINFFDFAEKKNFELSYNSIKDVLFKEEAYILRSSEFWSNDYWAVNQINRDFKKSNGLKVLREGSAKGSILGGNIDTLVMLNQKYILNLEGEILFLETADRKMKNHSKFFREMLFAISQFDGFYGLKGIVFGRFQSSLGITTEAITDALDKIGLYVPTIMNADFGHTNPKNIFPIGGYAAIDANINNPEIKIINH